MKDLGLIISIVVGFGYVLGTAFYPSRQQDKYYYSLFELKPFLVNCLISFALLIFGLWRRENFDGREIGYGVPIIYIFLLRLIDWFFILIYGRHVILATRWDAPPRGKDGIKFWDRIAFVIILSSLPFASALLMNQLNFGVWSKN